MWGFFANLLSLSILLFQEYQKRAEAEREEKYIVTQVEFQNLASAVLTRLRLQASKDSRDSKNMESQAEDDLEARIKKEKSE